MKKIILFFKEIKSVYTFYRKLKKSERDVVFYAEDISSYGYFEGLIDRLIDIEGRKICYITSAFDDPILNGTVKNITALYVKLLLPLFIVTLNSKVLLMTMPDLNRFHIRRSELGAHHVYMFHNIGSSFPVIRHGALFHYDTIFCAGPHHIEEIRIKER